MTGAEEPTDSPPAGERGRARPTWGWRIAAGLSVLAALAGAVAALVSTQRADEWRDRAEERGRVLEQLSASLLSAEEELAMLEARLEELASEKAGTEDEAAVAEVTIAQLEELVRQAGLVADDLDTCARGAVEVVEIVSDLGSFDLDEVARYVEEVQVVCGRALGTNEALQEAIEGLGATADGEEPGG